MSRSIVAIDSRLADLETLISALPEAEHEIVLIDGAGDGWAALAAHVAGRQDLNAIHVLGHGADGAAWLGQARLDHGSLAAYADALQQIGAALDEDGDLLLYGCTVAAGGAGVDFIGRVAALTGADVAASDDLTGAGLRGGDCDLEYRVGPIAPDAVFDGALFAAWDGLLGQPMSLTASDSPTYVEGGNAVAVAPTLTITDGTDAITEVRVAIDDSALETGDTLSFTAAHGVTGQYSAALGVLSLSGSATDAQWQEVLRSVTFESSGDPAQTSKDVTFTVVDTGSDGKDGGEILVSQVEAANNFQDEPSIATLSDDGFVIVWQARAPVEDPADDDSGDTRGVFGQRYDSDGNTVGGEFQINTFTDDDQDTPVVAGLTGGGFVVAWESDEQAAAEDPTLADYDGDNDSDNDVYAQRYDANGDKAGSEFRVNTWVVNPAGDSDDAQEVPDIAALTGGGFVIVWSSEDQDNGDDGYGVYGQRYAANGTPQGGEFLVNTEVADDQENPRVAVLTNGGFVVVWESDDQDGDGEGVYGQRYDSNGATVGAEFLINETTDDDQETPFVASMSDGGFVVTWTSDQGGTDDVYFRRYDANGTAVTSETRVNTTTANDQFEQSVTELGDGGFAVAWESLQGPDEDNDDTNVFAQRYNASNSAVGDEIQVNTHENGQQDSPVIAPLANGGFIVAWEGPPSDVDSDDNVYAQRFKPVAVEVEDSVTLTVQAASDGGGGGGGGGGGTTQTGSTTETTEGTTVTTTTTPNSDGTTTETKTVDPFDGFQEGEDPDDFENALSDHVLAGDDDDTPALVARLPLGVGLTSSGKTTPQTPENALLDLIIRIENETEEGSETQTEMTGAGRAFLNGLAEGTQLYVNTVTPTVAGNTPPDQPIVITGGDSGGGTQEALVIDVSGLPSGTVLQLDGVEFAAIVGGAIVNGGTGNNVVVGDNSAQIIVLGAGDDILDGGAGDDQVGSEGGDDILIGGLGNDTITGGDGVDAAEYAGAFTDAIIVRGETVTVTDAGGTDQIGEDVELLAFVADRGLTLVRPDGNAIVAGVGFDPQFYLARNADVAAAVEAGRFVDAADHFVRYGLGEDRAANAVFDSAWYLSTYTDVADAVAAGVFASAEQHYAQYGAGEGRDPGGWFDASAYLDANADVVEAGMSAMEHFVVWGAGEGRMGVVLDDGLLVA